MPSITRTFAVLTHASRDGELHSSVSERTMFVVDSENWIGIQNVESDLKIFCLMHKNRRRNHLIYKY